MKIESLLNALEDQSMQEVARQIDVHPKTIQRRLKKIGYQYDKKSMKWTWPHKEDAPLDRDILEGMRAKPQTTTHQVKQKQEEKTVLHPTGHTQALSGDEIRQLREIIAEWPKTSQNQSDGHTVHDRIKQMDRSQMRRKTVLIQEDVSDRLDRFTQENRVDKQDIISLALIDFLDQYE